MRGGRFRCSREPGGLHRMCRPGLKSQSALRKSREARVVRPALAVHVTPSASPNPLMPAGAAEGSPAAAAFRLCPQATARASGTKVAAASTKVLRGEEFLRHDLRSAQDEGKRKTLVPARAAEGFPAAAASVFAAAAFVRQEQNVARGQTRRFSSEKRSFGCASG